MKIFNNKNRSVFSNNVESEINFDLSTKVRLLPNESVVKYLSLYDRYNKERDECNKFRIILAINPICSNVLYNSKTEIVINEGSNNVKVICDCSDGTQDKSIVAKNATNTKDKIRYIDAIRNTEYSHPDLGGFKYHCGYDIFNNHILRNDGYVHVNKPSGTNGDVYNTILDYLRDSNGNVIKQDIDVRTTGVEKDIHLYKYDTVLSMKTAFYERCEERDGWWGFYNSSNINIPNRDKKQESILTNTLLADRKPCEFIDLYPDRSLYSFIPKYNPYRKRLEYNWDYCITYPFENDYELINTVCDNDVYSIKAIFVDKYNSNGASILECSSYFKHNLKVDDKINIYYKTVNGTQKFRKSVTIVSIGDNNGENRDRVFSISTDDILPIYSDLTNSLNGSSLLYKKVSDGEECRYYFRKFKKLKNTNGGDLRSEINKIAFGKNIYGDDVAQVIFTDDIDLTGLFDNNNRPVSEVFFTVIKRNAGHDIWYEEGNMPDSDKGNSKVEYSHCFGKVTSGLNFSGMKNEPFNYNIHKMHNLKFDDDNFKTVFRDDVSNIDFDFHSNGITYNYIKNNSGLIFSGTVNPNISRDVCRTFVVLGDSVLDKPDTIEDNITIDMDVFYGDVAEFDNSTGKETIISNMYHRVNTAQRETFDKCFRDILHDKIVRDDFDFTPEVGKGDENTFKVETYYLNDVTKGNSIWTSNSTTNSASDSMNDEKQLIYGNISPEGNYYKPHTSIRLIEESDTYLESEAKLINFGETGFSINNLLVEIVYPTNYGFYKGDYIAFYNKKNGSTCWAEITSVDESLNKLKLTILTDGDYKSTEFTGSTKIYYAYWSPNSVPTYANISTHRKLFVWRPLIQQSELKRNSPLYESTFSNGRIYIEKNINFFLRRQDPFGSYGLSGPRYHKLAKEFTNPVDDFIIGGSKQADFTGILYSINNFDNCY